MPSSTNFSRRVLFALSAAMIGCSAAVAGADIEYVTVGGETKRVEGILREAQSGDVSCYLMLEGDDGETFYESAGFDICEDTGLINKRVRLSYSIENVLAAECEGDVDCGKSDQIVLVNAAKAVPEATKSGKASFCTDTETTVFACSTGAKLVSVCASADAGSLQYRFGKPDGNGPLEMSLPKRAMTPAQTATGASVPFSGGGGSWLRFRNGDYAYVVYSGIGRWGPNGETIEKEGVAVERNGEQVANLPCSGPLKSELGPEWFEQVGITDNEEWFDFPE